MATNSGNWPRPWMIRTLNHHLSWFRETRRQWQGRQQQTVSLTAMSKSATLWRQTTGISKYIMKSRAAKLIEIHLNTWAAHLTQRSLKRPWKPWKTRSLLVPTLLPMRYWNTLAPKQSPNSWESSITAGRQGMFLRDGEKLTEYPSTRRARIKQIQTAIVLSASPVVWTNSWKD